MRFGFQTQSLQLKQHMFVIQNITLIHFKKINVWKQTQIKDIFLSFFFYFFIGFSKPRRFENYARIVYNITLRATTIATQFLSDEWQGILFAHKS